MIFQAFYAPHHYYVKTFAHIFNKMIKYNLNFIQN